MSETFDPNVPLVMNQHAKWYRLGGAALEAVRRALDLRNNTAPRASEINHLAKILGREYPVRRSLVFVGMAGVFPEIFAAPSPRDDSFYMLCPIGMSPSNEETSFVPDGSTELNPQEVQELTFGLFPAHGASVPVIQFNPVRLSSPATPTSAL